MEKTEFSIFQDAYENLGSIAYKHPDLLTVVNGYLFGDELTLDEENITKILIKESNESAPTRAFKALGAEHPRKLYYAFKYFFRKDHAMAL